MKYSFKKLLLNFLSKLGVLGIIHKKNTHKITTLTLHGVMNKNDNCLWNPLRKQLSTKELERTLKILSKYYQFITVDQSVEMLLGNIPIIDHALLLTFDDGYRNTIDYALPICEKFGIKPLLFVTTGHIDSGEPFWFDRLDYALQQNMGVNLCLEHNGVNYFFDATSRSSLTISYKKFRDYCKKTFHDDIEMNILFNALSEKLELRAGKSLRNICPQDDWSGIVTWTELNHAVTNNRIDIASHTVNHWRLNSLSREQILFELQHSKEIIEDKLAIQCHYFCYPNGSYNDLAINLVKESGYIAAFTTDSGLCQLNDNLISLKRLHFPVNKSELEIIYQLNR